MNNRTITFLGHFIEKIIEKMTDILLPKEEKVRLLEKLGSAGIYENIPRAQNFDIPTQASFDNNKIKAIFCYKTALCRQAIWEIKYRANKKLIHDFSLLLYEFILEELDDLRTFQGFKNIILLPIPASPSRNKEKGFNQCVLICRELIKIDQERNGHNFTLLEDFLIKKNDTAHQARVSNRKARLKNLINTFSIDLEQVPGKLSERLVRVKRRELPGDLSDNNHSGGFPDSQPLTSYSFIIIDDVITTGATMTEAFRALKSAGISPRKIRGYSLAH
jgi:predicted amidophosphoribosyltransferase